MINKKKVKNKHKMNKQINKKNKNNKNQINFLFQMWMS